MVPPDCVVLLDDLGVEEGNEENGSKDGKSNSDAHRHRCDVPGRLLVQSELWRTLVNNGKCANGTSDEEEKG